MQDYAGSIERMIEEQVHRWEILGRNKKVEAVRGPIVTLSREYGTKGHELAHRLSESLGLDLFDRKIIQRIAESAQISEAVVRTLDEKNRAFVEDWITATVQERAMTPDEYGKHLLRVIGTIATHGNAVIVGRGANFILPPKEHFALRIVAPIHSRVQNVSLWLGLDEEAALARVEQVDADRRAFVKKHMNAEVADPSKYHMVVNSHAMSVEAILDAVKAAIRHP